VKPTDAEALPTAAPPVTSSAAAASSLPGGEGSAEGGALVLLTPLDAEALVPIELVPVAQMMAESAIAPPVSPPVHRTSDAPSHTSSHTSNHVASHAPTATVVLGPPESAPGGSPGSAQGSSPGPTAAAPVLATTAIAAGAPIEADPSTAAAANGESSAPSPGTTSATGTAAVANSADDIKTMKIAGPRAGFALDLTPSLPSLPPVDVAPGAIVPMDDPFALSDDRTMPVSSLHLSGVAMEFTAPVPAAMPSPMFPDHSPAFAPVAAAAAPLPPQTAQQTATADLLDARMFESAPPPAGPLEPGMLEPSPYEFGPGDAGAPGTSVGDEGPLDEKTTDLRLVRPAKRPEGHSEDNGRLATEEGVTVEGAPVEDHRTEVAPVPPARGTMLTADDQSVVQLEDSLGEQGGMVFYRARLLRDGFDVGQPFTAVWAPQAPPEPPWSHLPDARLVRPLCRVTLDRAAVRVFERPRGNTVIDFLADEQKSLGAMQVIELGLELAEMLEGLHGAGCFLYDIDPAQIVIERGGRVRLYAVNGLYGPGQLPRGALGPFCAPEVRRRSTFRISHAADVYAVALLLYLLLAKRAPIELDTDPSLLVSPRVFRPECPLGIWPLLRTCLEANPLRRVGHARGMRSVLEQIKARLLAEVRATEQQLPVLLESWAELHAGITKARRGSNQQDRAVSLTDETARTGLYVIADGVSRARYGDGAFAAEQVEAAAQQRWAGLEKGGLQAIDLEHSQRADILRQISRSAGKKIALEVNAKYAPLPQEPNQVMSATMVAAFVVDGEATLGNLGDSRAYLVRDGIIEQISIDHDRTTDALRLGLSFREAAHVHMGSALTRVVGRVVIDDDGSCRADPFEPELFQVRLLPGDRLVLCSDGVADFVAGPGVAHDLQDETIKRTVLDHEDPARAAFELVVLANRAGGFDNISCIVIAVHPA
jgi:serine/threonine protein phosphatase PrpC